MAKRLTPAWLLLWGVTVYACGGEQVSTEPEALTVASVTVTPDSATFTSLGVLKLFTATAHDAAGNKITGKTFTWESSAENVAVVSRLGIVTSVADGGVTITAAVDGISGSASVTVEQTPAKVFVTPVGASLSGVGATQAFNAEVQDAKFNVMALPVTWSSLNPNIATIGVSGLATTAATGQVSIAATVQNMTAGYAVLTVSEPGMAPIATWNSVVIDPTVDLFGVWGVSSSDIYAVGLGGKIYRYDGIDWTAMTSGTSQSLRDVWGTAADDVYAVGTGGTILRYDGADWSTMPLEESVALFGVWGASPSNIYAVGSRRTIVDFDGKQWRTVTSEPGPFYFDVWGSSASDVFVVGGEGTILHFDGSAWTGMTSGTTAELRGVWGTSSSDVYGVGQDGTILHYDGAAWSPMTSGTTDDLWTVWGTSSTDIYAAGGLFALGSVATILHYDGTTWTSLTSAPGPVLYSLWGNSTGVYAVGASGEVRKGTR